MQQCADEMIMEGPTWDSKAPLAQSNTKAGEGLSAHTDSAHEGSPMGRQDDAQRAKATESTSVKQGVLKGGKLTKGGGDAEGGSQKQGSTGKKKITWVNLPDKVPTAEDKPSRAPTVRAKAADVLSSFPRAAVPNAARVTPRIRAQPAAVQGKSGSSIPGQSRKAGEGPAAPQPKPGAAAQGSQGLSSFGRRGPTEPASSKKAKDADDDVLAVKLAAAAKLSEKPAISMEFSTFKPSSVLRQQS